MIATRASQVGISLNLLEVTVSSEVDYRGVLGLDDSISPAMANLRPQVKIAADGISRAALIDLVRWGVQHSPVARTITAGKLSEAEINAS